MKIQFTSSTLTRQLNVSRIIRVLFLALAAFATPSALSAQEQGIITLLPIEVRTEGEGCKSMTIQGQNNRPKCKVILRFQTNSIPAGAKVNAAHLMMVGGMKATQTITVYVNDNNLVFGEITPRANESFPPNKRADWVGKDFRDKINAAPAASFSLILQTTSNGLASEWKNDMDVSGSRPRLTLEYTVAGREGIVQSEGVPATKSPTSFLPKPTAAAQFGSREVSGIWSFAPVFYNGLVYLIRENQLQALTALGAPVWSLPLDKPGQHLLLSRSGRMYIVGAGKILVYQLQADPKAPATEVKTSGGQPLSPKLWTNFNPLLAPAVGADGSLYFVSGQEVYGQNPDLQELWKVTLTNTTTSRVTVGPSGRFVYLTAKGEGLVAIDAQTGERVTVPAPANGSQSKLADNKIITFHAPVVIQHPDGTEKIYVAANSVDDGVLADFDNPRTKPRQRTPGSITADWEPLPGLWSQPLPDLISPGTINEPSTTKRIYAVSVKNSQGTLTAINWLSGSAQPQAASFPVAGSPDLLNLASNGAVLGVDKDGTVFVWDGTGVKLYVFTPQSSVAALPLATSSGLTVGSRLAFGSDGTLYLADSGNAANRTLRAIVPQYTLVNSSSEKIISPTHLRVDGVVDKNTELTAPGSVFLRDGFTVKQGVTLTVKQPKP